mmetsp:Transcript_54038/g.128415  ORF Transcript_54038/g.128415 Transcript_54038/m.128415 type:complete len:202 (+) Transcript_54038:412-1017(+)
MERARARNGPRGHGLAIRRRAARAPPCAHPPRPDPFVGSTPYSPRDGHRDPPGPPPGGVVVDAALARLHGSRRVPVPILGTRRGHLAYLPVARRYGGGPSTDGTIQDPRSLHGALIRRALGPRIAREKRVQVPACVRGDPAHDRVSRRAHLRRYGYHYGVPLPLPTLHSRGGSSTRGRGGHGRAALSERPPLLIAHSPGAG